MASSGALSEGEGEGQHAPDDANKVVDSRREGLARVVMRASRPLQPSMRTEHGAEELVSASIAPN